MVYSLDKIAVYSFLTFLSLVQLSLFLLFEKKRTKSLESPA